MHGFSLGSNIPVNAEVDSMGGLVDGGVGIDTKSSPRKVEIEKAQAELRLEYDVREERRRELEYLEKGGDPLDFKFGHVESVSVQSTSQTDQHPHQNLISEAKGSFALTASPHGDSVESSGRLGITTASEPNSADNFDGEHVVLESDKKTTRPFRFNITLPGRSSQLDGCRNVKDFEDSPVFHLKKGQAYRRRNRSRTNRDGPRSTLVDVASRGGNVSSMPVQHKVPSDPVASGNQFEMELDGTHVTHLSTPRVTDFAEEKLGLSNSKENQEQVQNPSFKMDKAPVAITIIDSASAVAMDNIHTVDVGCLPSSSAEITEDNGTSEQPKDTNMINGDGKRTPTDALIENAPVTIKGVDLEPSCTQTNVTVDRNRNVDGDLCTNLKNLDTNGSPKEPTLPVGENSVSREEKQAIEDPLTDGMVTASSNKEGYQVNALTKDQAEVDMGKSSLENNVKGLSNVEVQEEHNITETKTETVPAQLDICASEIESCCPVTLPVVSGPSPEVEHKHSVENMPKPLDKAQEDKILEEAQMIEAKRKRIAELSISELPKEHRRKGHWDLVLEEMAWLANDFAQERLWKLTAAAQICRRMAFASRKRLEEQIDISKQKSVARTLAKTVMEFWHSARLSADDTNSSALNKCEASTRSLEMDKSSQDVLQSTRRIQRHAVHEYAVRFIQFNCSPKTCVEVPEVTDAVSFPEVSWEDQFTEENLFYAVPHGAMEMYRKSIESCLVKCERRGNNNQEEVDTSGLNARAECGFEDNGYEEDEGENAYYLPGALDTSKPSKKSRKIMKLHTSRPYEYGSDFGYGNCADTRNGTVQFNEMGKRPANSNSHHVDPIPTKRMRTASRPRVVGPSGAGPAGLPPVLSRGDASSGDTNSFQDDQTIVRGGSIAPRGSEVDSAMKFENHSTYDSAEMSAKPKKKKKSKHQSVPYDQRWQLDSSIQNEQKDLVRKRLDNHQLESNGNGGLFGQHAKKPKLAKQSVDNSFDNTAPMSGSPVASQMSNMSNQTKIIKFIAGRDRGKKGKGLKVSTGQLGSGTWTTVEDQALVVLVHDMGPNWELVSDAINNILHFKCIFRKPHECKERHKVLMDRPAGDNGADSADDSGSSQSYPSTLPGIPKGSARQLFRSLHAHVEENNIKSRFEKIIRIEQQLHFRKKKNDNQDLKQIAPIHGSHAFSLSQVIPNNVNGGVLTPLDLCDTAVSNHELIPIEYASSHAGGLQAPNQSNIQPPAGLNLSHQGLHGSPSMGIGNNLASPSSQLTSSRDARHTIHRPGTLAIEEQQRLHQFNSMLPGRNVQASTVTSSGSLSGSDRGVRMHAGGNGANVTPGTNRSMPLARPGVQGISSSSMLKSGGVLTSNLGGIPSNSNAHSGTASSQGNIAFRARDSLPGVRPVQNVEHQRRIISPEMKVQTTQPNSSGVPAFGVSSGFSNQTPSPLPTYPHVLGNPQPHLSTSNHAVTPEQIRSSRENQIKLRLLQRQRQLQQHAQTPSHLPTSSPIPSNSQLHSPSSPPMTHLGPQPHQQQKNLPGHVRNAQSGPGGRQRQAQQQLSVRQHPQQRQQSQSQPAKLVKGIGRGNTLIHQNLPIDSSHLNGISANTASEVSEKGDLANYSTRPLSQPMSSAPSPNHLQPPKPHVSTGPAKSKMVHLISSAQGSNQGRPVVQRINQQHRQVNSDFSTKNQASNVVRTVHDPVSDFAMTSASSPSALSSNEAVTNALVNEPLPSGSQVLVHRQSSSKKPVSHGHESQWQQAAQLDPPPLEPILPQKKSQQQL